ncbi:MAG: class I SAM-dependent methyltransferase [Pseudomonadota bacterium]
MATQADWQGRTGREWARRTPALDAMLAPVGDAGLAALGPVEDRRILDLGCGAGATTRALAAAGALPTGIDISPDLLGLARQAAPNLTFVEGDAAKVAFDTPFDALFSRCGAMFFDAPAEALTHLRAQLHPGAPAVLTAWGAWGENAWAHLPLRAATGLLPEAADPMPVGPGPFAWAEPDVFAPLLQEAGWQDLAWTGFEMRVPIGLGEDSDPTARAADFVLQIGPLAARLRGKPAELKSWLRTELKGAFAPYVDHDTVRLPAKAWIITARA